MTPKQAMGELRSFIFANKNTAPYPFLILELFDRIWDFGLRKQNLAVNYAKQHMPDAPWFEIEWCLACRRELALRAWEFAYPCEEYARGEANILKGLLFMALHRLKIEHTTCAARVSDGRYAVVCVMEHDECPLVLLGCYDESFIEQASGIKMVPVVDEQFDKAPTFLVESRWFDEDVAEADEPHKWSLIPWIQEFPPGEETT